ncbi:META domain-containing protein [Lysobacter brunescens]|uniref:META domain-containing protein n=1 Tax=Lysobacter brunescens TaxID=262323 RepID=A0ABW2YC38_9GAMM
MPSSTSLRAVLSIAALLSASIAIAAPAPGASADAGDKTRSLRVDRNELVNTGGWKLASATGAQADALRAPGVAFEVSFTGKDVRANGGCNDLRGTYEVSGKRMTFQIAIATRMSCEDEKNRADQAFSELMNRSFKAELLEPLPYRLRLTSDDGQVLEFEQLPMKI